MSARRSARVGAMPKRMLPNDLYRTIIKKAAFMPFKQAPTLQAAAFAAVLQRTGLFAVAQTRFERQLLKRLCLAWAELYSDSVQVPHCVTSLLFTNDDPNYAAVRTALINYAPSPNLPFVNGLGCMRFQHNGLKFVGILRMEHKKGRDGLIMQRNWDLIYVECYVTRLNDEFYNQLVQECTLNGSCNLNVLLYKFYEKTCII
ncbi:hypothetical protein Spob106 [Spilosoma obliqua nucleopolyhedrosis virus]|nr:hypothetical protein Spob106 [Spilosoma obliqua nucleopolyhedrosis virus]